MEKDKEILKEKVEKNILDKQELSFLEELIKQNSLEFELNGKKYRLRRPTISEKNEIYQKKMIKFYELLNDPKWQSVEQIIKSLKEKGIDLNRLEKEIEIKIKEKEDAQIELAKTINEESRERYKNLVSEKDEELNNLVNKKLSYLSFSLEHYLDYYIKTYSIYIISEEFKDNKYQKIFNNYEEFINSNDVELIKSLTYRINVLIYDGEFGD